MTALLHTLLFSLFLMSAFVPRVYADLQDDPVEEPTPSAKEPGKNNSSGLIRDESERKQQTTSKTKDEKPTDSKKPARQEKITDKAGNQTGGSSSANSNTPIKYSSERLAGQKQGGVVVLEENVVVTQADMRIEADKATIHFDQATNEVIDCVAVGNVKFFRRDPETGNPVTADGREAVFNNRDRTVTLKGDPKLVRGGDVVRGRQIIYDLTSGWVKADRVEGVVQPSKQDSSKSGTAGAGKTAGQKTDPKVDPKSDIKKEPTAIDAVELKESPKP